MEMESVCAPVMKDDGNQWPVEVKCAAIPPLACQLIKRGWVDARW